MINTSVFTNREMTVAFKQPTRVAYVGSPSFTSGSFIEWEMPQTYESDTTMRFPYGVMSLDGENVETDITYTDDAQTIHVEHNDAQTIHVEHTITIDSD